MFFAKIVYYYTKSKHLLGFFLCPSNLKLVLVYYLWDDYVRD